MGRDAQRTSYSPVDLDIPENTYDGLSLLWNWFAPNEAAVNTRVQPVIAEGVLAVGTVDGIMHALAENTGEVLWQYQTKAAIVNLSMWFLSLPACARLPLHTPT